MIKTLSLSSALLLILIQPATALINVTLPSGNTSAPTGLGDQPSDPGFAYVGKVDGSEYNGSGVYLGNGWVLTANHVGAGTFNLDGTNYSYNGTDSYQIGGADLLLFKLSTNPMLTPLTIATTSPTIGDDVVMIAAGRSPTSDATTTWYVDTTPETWVWNTSPFDGWDSIGQGYTTTSTKTSRWGTNVVENVASGYIVTDFDQTGGTAYESQVVTNDSGGGLFIDNGSGWELAGTMVGSGTFNGQPDDANSAVFGNESYALDLSVYAEEINSIVPEPSNAAWLAGILSLLMLGRRKRV